MGSRVGEEIVRWKWQLYGAVQGVGFRPFVYRLAKELSLTGWVANSLSGLNGEVEGDVAALKVFRERLLKEKPGLAVIHGMEDVFLDAIGFVDFEIRESATADEKSAIVLPDLATCPDCLRDINDPQNRRYQYPFTNCTQCGPRYSIIESLPYDRLRTAMKNFVMCDDCRREYEDPTDRRFHAQPNACPVCGPQLAFWDEAGTCLAQKGNALTMAVDAVRDGKIVAVKGLGGFHLIVDAGNEEAVKRLRQRKHREEKPFALMFPLLVAIKEVCEVGAEEENLLTAVAAPIVLLKKRQDVTTRSRIVDCVAPGNPNLGVMLPYTPLHHLLLAQLNRPVVATSGNLADEPICIDENEALARLKGIADFFLVHNRPIVRPVDDSIVRIMAGRPFILRRARGFAPLPVRLNVALPTTLAMGAHLKNTVALNVEQNVYVSQHIGDLSTKQAWESFRQTIKTIQQLYPSPVEIVACDLHPDYLSSQEARGTKLQQVAVQHHFAHVVSCMAENDLDEEVLGIAWDGTGLGDDKTVWGGEFLLATRTAFKRVGYFRSFPLVGGEKAIKEPRRAALGILSLLGDEVLARNKALPTLHAFSMAERTALWDMACQPGKCPMTSSVGRLFDAVSSLIGLQQDNHFEGQAAMAMEFALDEVATNPRYEVQICPASLKIGASGLREGAGLVPPGSRKKETKKGGLHDRIGHAQSGVLMVDWEKMIRSVIADFAAGVDKAQISAKFHNALIEAAVAMARQFPGKKVVLSGGCFQNKYLLEGLVRRLNEEGIKPYWHQRIPTNDGGISLGQLVVAGCQQGRVER